MKTWAKVGIGCLAALLLVCIISIIVVLVTGGSVFSKFKSFAKQAEQSGKSQTNLLSLNKQFQFNPSPDGNIDERQLVSYIKVCTQMKPDSDAYKAWLESKKNSNSPFKTSQEMLKKWGSLSEKATKALQSEKMGPEEFLWMHNQLLSASMAGPGDSLTEGQKQVIKVLQDQLRNQDLPSDQRQQIQQQIDNMKAQTGQLETITKNAKLYQKYKQQLDANNIDPILPVFSGEMKHS